MKRKIRNLLILLAPIAFMILVNETTHLPTKPNTEKCSWECHRNTNHCKMHHVKFLKPYFEKTDPLYFGIIDSFHETGKYQLVNVLVLGVMIPLFIYWLLISVIEMEIKIRKLK